jgi:hypothetical protein
MNFMHVAVVMFGLTALVKLSFAVRAVMQDKALDASAFTAAVFLHGGLAVWGWVSL